MFIKMQNNPSQEHLDGCSVCVILGDVASVSVKRARGQRLQAALKAAQLEASWWLSFAQFDVDSALDMAVLCVERTGGAVVEIALLGDVYINVSGPTLDKIKRVEHQPFLRDAAGIVAQGWRPSAELIAAALASNDVFLGRSDKLRSYAREVLP